MPWLLLTSLIPLMTTLMEIAEKMLGSGTGEEKKNFVMDSIIKIIKFMPSVSSGGQKETWDGLNFLLEPIKKLVDILAGVLFPHK